MEIYGKGIKIPDVDYKLIVNSNVKTSHHLWINEDPLKKSFESINSQLLHELYERFPERTVFSIYGMNEVYVSNNDQNTKSNSDEVFITTHIDGPFFFFPGVNVYRFILALNENQHISTIIEGDNPRRYTLSTGEYLGFDFNRTPHRIEVNTTANVGSVRVVLKLHYCVTSIYWYGFFVSILTMCYDRIARVLFLYTLNPETFSQRFISNIIIRVTRFWVSLINIFFLL